MSSAVPESQSSNNQNSSATEDVKQQVNNSNENDHTQRQLQSSFQPSTNVEQVADQLQSLNVGSKVTMRSDAPPFTPSSEATKTSAVTIAEQSGTAIKTNLVYDLKKFKYDYFISELSCSSDRENGKFGAPTGVCTLADDRLLVANFDRDSVLLLDIKGVVHHIFKDLPTPKAVIYNSSTSQAVVATRKEAVILDLNTKKTVVRSKIRGFYPWNIQHIQDRDVYAACDPSGERIVFLDNNLAEIGVWSFHDSSQDHLLQSQPQLYQKVYPYAAYFLANDISFVLTHRQDKCRLEEYDNTNATPKSSYNIPDSLQSYSIFVDQEKKCLIADKLNHRLVSVDKDSKVEEYRCKSIQEPYSMTFLSTGTLCVTDWNKSHGTSGGLAIISEVNLKEKQ